MEKCRLCQVLENEKDKFLYEDKQIVMLPPKDMKGHHKRIMLLPKNHIPYAHMSKLWERNWSVRFIAFCKDYFDEEPTFVVCNNDFCTIPGHWHMIACDWFGTPEELEQLRYTSHIAVKSKVLWSPKKGEQK